MDGGFRAREVAGRLLWQAFWRVCRRFCSAHDDDVHVGVTALGAPLIFSMKVNRKLLDAMLVFSAGAMTFVVAGEPIPEAKRGS